VRGSLAGTGINAEVTEPGGHLSPLLPGGPLGPGSPGGPVNPGSPVSPPLPL